MYFSVQRQMLFCLAPVLLAALPAMALRAEKPPPAGGDYNLQARTDQPTAVAVDYRQAQPVQQSPASDDYLQAIESLEREFGPYHSDLAQHLTSMGISLQENGRYVEAQEVFDRAMHLSRINEGLYSLSQLPILEHLIEANVAAGDWESASENHDYLFWLHRRNFNTDDPRMLPTLEKLSKWHLNAFVKEVDDGMLSHLVNAHILFASAANIIEHSFGAADLRLVKALRGLTVSNYYLASFQNYNEPRAGFEANFSNSQQQQEEQLRIEQYILRSYNNGKDAITRIQQVYEQNEDAPADAVLRAQVDLADWQMMFNRTHSAKALYREAIEAIEKHPEAASLRQELFGEPVELPNMSDWEMTQVKGRRNDEFVVVKFDVTATGRARNIKFIESYPEDKARNRSKVRKSLKATRFRPRFENGEAVTTENLTRRYVFTD